MMRFSDGQHRFYAGIDLHARFMHACVLDAAGKVVQAKDRAALTWPRRPRVNPCVVKHQVSNYAKKHPHHRGLPSARKPFLETVVMLI